MASILEEKAGSLKAQFSDSETRLYNLLGRYEKLIEQVILPNHINGINLKQELEQALRNPIDSEPLKDLCSDHDKVVIVILDDSRAAPQRAMIEAILREIKHVRFSNISLLIATGTHKETDPARLALGKNLLAKFKIMNHYSRNANELVTLGEVSSRFHQLDARLLSNDDLVVLSGLCHDDEEREIFKKENLLSKRIVKINKNVLEADVIILLGSIKPHYFAGFSGGAKSLVPGLIDRSFIIRNHLLKIHPEADLGNVNGNVLRDELEEAAKLVQKKMACLNIIMNRSGDVIKAVSGDIISAHRKGVEWARPLFEASAEKTNVVVVSESWPVSMNVKQMKKVLRAAGMIVKPHGVVIIVGSCREGLGSGSKINDYVYKLYLKNKMPEDVSLLLVSDLKSEEAERTGFLKCAASFDFAMDFAREKLGKNLEISVVPNGTLVIPKKGE